MSTSAASIPSADVPDISPMISMPGSVSTIRRDEVELFPVNALRFDDLLYSPLRRGQAGSIGLKLAEDDSVLFELHSVNWRSEEPEILRVIRKSIHERKPLLVYLAVNRSQALPSFQLLF